MVFNKSELRIYEQYNIKLTDEVLGKLEDAARVKKDLLITIDASHLGMVNGHGVIYRHDTIKNNIQSFIYPNSKPMIERHKTATSETFGHIVAADFKHTKFYDQLDKDWQLEGLTTSEYFDLCRDVLIPTQNKTNGYNGIAYVQVMGKLKHQDAIDKVLRKEFLNVSIGADPKKLICSACGQDQVHKICDHYSQRGNGVFMLAEQLEYEELSFVPRGADPYGKVIQIHDEVKLLDAYVDVFDYNDFHKITENKTIVCVNNICKICDEEEEMARRKVDQTVVSVSYAEEFTADKVEALKLADMELPKENIDLKLDELADDMFAIVQKTDEGMKRRFPLHDEENVKAAMSLIGSAEDLTDAESVKAKKAIAKGAKKFGIECACNEKEEAHQPEVAKIEDAKPEVRTVQSITDELVALLKEVDLTKLEDGVDTPLTSVLTALSELEGVDTFVSARLETQGKEIVEKGALQTITDELKEAQEEIATLDNQNIELNYLVRVSLVDEILVCKGLEDEAQAEERKRLSKLGYDTLKEVASELRKNPTKTNAVVINNKEIKTVKDPTLADELGGEEVAKLEDESNKKPLTLYQQTQLLAAYFKSNNR